MPIFDYQCTNCGHRDEFLEKREAESVKACPSCHQHELKRQVSAPQFQLKGTGWYVTDFRDKGKKPTAEAGDAKSASKDEKMDAKPAEKKEAPKKPDTKSTDD